MIGTVKISLLFGLLLLALPAIGQQQYYEGGRPQQPVNNNNGLQDRLFYGGNLILNFGSSNTYSEFNIGISPLIGFKVFPGFSVGPRGTIIYSNVKIRNQVGLPDAQESNFTWAVGAFARYRIIPQIFAHAEYELEQVPFLFYDGSGDLVTQRVRRDNFYIGGGFYSGGRVGVEILALYNVINTTNQFYTRSPFVIRFGVVAGF